MSPQNPAVDLRQNCVFPAVEIYSGGQFSIFWLGSIIDNHCRVLIVVEQTSDTLMFFSLALSAETSSGTDAPLRTTGSTSFKVSTPSHLVC